MGNLFECSTNPPKAKVIMLPLFQAAQTRRSDADNSSALLTLYNSSGFKSMTGLFNVKSSEGVFNGASFSVFVSDDNLNWQNVYERSTRTNNYSEQVTVSLNTKKYLKLELRYLNQSGAESNSYGAFLLNTTINTI